MLCYAMFTAFMLGTKHGIHNQAKALETTRVFYIVSKQHELWSTNGLKMDRSSYQTPVNSAFYFIARLRSRTVGHQQTELYETLPNSAQ